MLSTTVVLLPLIPLVLLLLHLLRCRRAIHRRRRRQSLLLQHHPHNNSTSTSSSSSSSSSSISTGDSSRLDHCNASSPSGPPAMVVGVFHPYSDGGGGGERVLWCAIRALQGILLKKGNGSSSNGGAQVVLYTGDYRHVGSSRQIEQRIKEHFNITLMGPVRVVPITTRHYFEWASTLPFTLLLQGLASMVMAYEAVMRCPPCVFVDTTGLSFAYPMVKLLCPPDTRIACYTHYPTISTDMLQRVEARIPAHNNPRSVAASAWRTAAKTAYYRVFASLYGATGRLCVDSAMVNSSWTYSHIASLWGMSAETGPQQLQRLRITYPPVDVSRLVQLPLRGQGHAHGGTRERIVLSVGQFRPEKDHQLQIESFALFLQQHPQYTRQDKLVRLCLLGGCRGSQDEARVDALRDMARQLGVHEQVEFLVNASYDTLYRMLGESLVGLHTMWNEHFGICVVEYMAAGLIPLAHRSGGPLADIVVPEQETGLPTGYLAETKQEYADALYEIIHGYFDSSAEERQRLERMQQSARNMSRRFSEEKFVESATQAFSLVL